MPSLKNGGAIVVNAREMRQTRSLGIKVFLLLALSVAGVPGIALADESLSTRPSAHTVFPADESLAPEELQDLRGEALSSPPIRTDSEQGLAVILWDAVGQPAVPRPDPGSGGELASIQQHFGQHAMS